MTTATHAKAAVCRRFGAPLDIETVHLAPPGAEEVRVCVAACAICQSDLHAIDGDWGGTLPSVFGHEASGTVLEMGAGVAAGLIPGTRVVISLLRRCGTCFFCLRDEPALCVGDLALRRESRLSDAAGSVIQQGIATGAFAEQVVVHQSQLVPFPDALSFEAAALLACGVLTGTGAALNTARIKAGESVAVIGYGGGGLNAVQGARLAGSAPLVALDPVASKREMALGLGAGHAFDPLDAGTAAAVRALTGGHGPDHVLVTVGNAGAMANGLALLRRGGTLTLAGMPATGATLPLELVDLANAVTRIQGSKMGGGHLARDVPRLIGLWEEGRLELDGLVSGRFPLSAINEAIASVKRGEAIRNVVTFADPAP